MFILLLFEALIKELGNSRYTRVNLGLLIPLILSVKHTQTQLIRVAIISIQFHIDTEYYLIINFKCYLVGNNSDLQFADSKFFESTHSS